MKLLINFDLILQRFYALKVGNQYCIVVLFCEYCLREIMHSSTLDPTEYSSGQIYYAYYTRSLFLCLLFIWMITFLEISLQLNYCKCSLFWDLGRGKKRTFKGFQKGPAISKFCTHYTVTLKCYVGVCGFPGFFDSRSLFSNEIIYRVTIFKIKIRFFFVRINL